MKSSQLFKLEGRQVCIICDGNDSKPELGTGFLFLKKDWIVTAAHVVIEDLLPRKNLYAVFPTVGKNTVRVQVIGVHREQDIALLQILGNDNPCSLPLYPGYDDLSVSNGLICCGYKPTTGNKIGISLAKTYTKEYRHRSDKETIIEFESTNIESGSSGGPIFGDGGVVLGMMINIFTIEEEKNKVFARATSIQNLMTAIKINFDKKILIPPLN